MPTSRSGKPLPQWGKGTACAASPQHDLVVMTGRSGNETATRPDPKGERTDETASPQEETPGAKQAQRSEGAAMA